MSDYDNWETSEVEQVVSVQLKKKKSPFPNPYEMSRRDVAIKHFRDARIYDEQAQEGFQVTSHFAKQKYHEWLRNIRKQRGWENFRRQYRISFVYKEIVDEDGNVSHQLVRADSIQKKANAGTNKNRTGTPQSALKGVKIDDEEFKAKMWTPAMGKEVARLRSSLEMTQADLAKKINVEPGIVRDIEQGGIVLYNPNDQMTRLLCKALNVSSIKYQ
jgi:DNA-binding XRE family transcriptional regulator